MTSGLKLVENIIGERWKRELPPQYSFVHMKNLKILHVEGEKNVKTSLTQRRIQAQLLPIVNSEKLKKPRKHRFDRTLEHVSPEPRSW